MTYGWAILTIAIVLVALFSLNFFSGSSLLGKLCIASPKQGSSLSMRTFKAQSAMEYLMTYGWAILTIAIVLGALFSLGVFSGSSLLPTSCKTGPGYYCQNPTLLSNGLLTFSFGQNTGANEYNAIIYVEPQSQLPGPSSPFFSSNYTNIGTFGLGQIVTPSITISAFSGKPRGTQFTGYVWLSYNRSSSTGTSNLLEKVATIMVKVS